MKIHFNKTNLTISTIFIIFLIVLCLVTLVTTTNVAYANNERIEKEILTEIHNDIEINAKQFTNKSILSIEFLYNLDEEPDFIYVRFVNEGYMVLFKNSLEVLQYSNKGYLPYEKNKSRRYYAGPNNYLKKIDGGFWNFSLQKKVVFTKNEIKLMANKIINFLSSEYEYKYADKIIENNNDSIMGKSSEPQIDKENLIIPDNEDAVLINNSNYFMKNPTHSFNNDNSCGVVAAQLLLSYNNYYNDRRIIDDKYLNGYNLSTQEVDIPENNPNYCENPIYMDCNTTGTNSVKTGSNSIFAELKNCIMGDNDSSTIYDIKNGLETFLCKNLQANMFDVNVHTNLHKSIVKSTINAGNPLIIRMGESLGGVDHFVVAYGYSDYSYSNSNQGTYSGYIVHSGWTNEYNIWVNSAWCNYYLTLDINHIHNYGTIVHNKYNEIRCLDCGHRTTTYLTESTGFDKVKVIGSSLPLTNLSTIPAEINGKRVTSIDNNAFMNEEKLMILNLSENLEYIGSNSFYGCEKLFEVNLPNTLELIGQNAFAYCKKLEEIEIPFRLDEIKEGAFGVTALSKISFGTTSSLTTLNTCCFLACELTEIFLPSSVVNIHNQVFQNCYNLKYISLQKNVNMVGNMAFLNCEHVTIYIESGVNMTEWHSNWNCEDRPVITGCNMSNGGYVRQFTKTSTNPSNSTAVNGITNPIREGYKFRGWYTDSDFSGERYNDLTTAPNGTLYVKWEIEDDSCVAKGTQITLADGTQKAVEDLTGDENLLVWNMMTGEFDTAPILFVDSEQKSVYDIIRLKFEDGTKVDVIDEHGFYNTTLNKYVYLDENAEQYIGDYFNKQTIDEYGNMIWESVKLKKVKHISRKTRAFSPVTYSHLCYYVNGMLSMPGNTESLVNIFDVDPVTMTIDMDSYYADIEEYGLFTYDEFCEIIPVTIDVYNAFNAKYFKVAIGKGILTLEELENLFSMYEEFLQ